MTARKKASPLAKKVASVGILRNGLSIEIGGVPADEAGIVAAELLRAMRTLITDGGFDELVPDAGSAHAHPIDQQEEPDGDDYTEPPHARKPMGF